MSSKDLSKLRGGLSRCIEIERTLNSLTNKRSSKIRSKGKKKSEIKKLEVSLTDPSTLTVNSLKQILGQNNLPTGGIKKELIARIVENDISLDHGLENQNIRDLESKLPEIEDRVKVLKTDIKRQSRNLKPLRRRKTEASESVRKAKNSWMNELAENENVLAFACGIILCLSSAFIFGVLDDAGTIVMYDEEGELTGFFGTLYSLLMCFSCCILPFCGGFLVSTFPSVFDPVSVAVKLHDSVHEELLKAEAPVNTSKIELTSLEGQISRVKQNIREIEKARKQIEKWEAEIEDLDKEISNLRVELKENYAEISHLLPFSYMLE